MERTRVLGVPIDPVDRDELIGCIRRALTTDLRLTLLYANAHTLELGQRDALLVRALERADVVFCDGFGVQVTCRALGLEPPPRNTPPDWIDELSGALATDRRSLFLLGGEPGVAAAAGAELSRRHPDLRLVGEHHGRFDRGSSADEEVLRTIERAAPDVLLVGLGQPRQELWIDRHRDRLPAIVIGVGALYEWLAGSDRRAPAWATGRGLEWAFRLLRHPRRHFRRYVIGLPTLFARAVLAQVIATPSPPAGPLRVAFAFGPTDGGRSGAYRHMRELLAELDKLDSLELDVFALERDRRRLPPGRFRTHTIEAAFGGRLWNDLWHRLVLPARARALGAHVLHLPYGNRRLATPARPPTMATIHDLAELAIPARYGQLRRVNAASIRARLPRATRLIAVSRETRKQLASIGVEPERIAVIANGHDSPSLDQATARARVARLGLDGPFLLYVARIEHPAKNHVRLLEATAMLHQRGRRVTLALAGAPWTRAEEVTSRVRHLHLEDAVRFLGFVSDPDLDALYNAADALIFPSLVEGFGLPVLEALAAGLPVAASDRPPLSEEFGGCYEPFDPEEPEAIAEAVVRLLDDNALRARRIAAGRARAADLTWQRAATETAAVYRDLAGPDAG